MRALMSTMLWVVVGCGADDAGGQIAAAGDAAPPPPPFAFGLGAPAQLVPGVPGVIQAEAQFGAYETVHLFASTRGRGQGPCMPQIGGACFGIRAPIRVASVTVYDEGYAQWEINVPPAVALNTTLHFQAVVVRGVGGRDSWLSEVTSSTVSSCYGDAATGDADGDLTCDNADICPNDATDRCNAISCLVDFEAGWTRHGEGAWYHEAYTDGPMWLEGEAVLTGGTGNGDPGGYGVNGTRSPAYLVSANLYMNFQDVEDLEFDVFSLSNAVDVEIGLHGARGDVFQQLRLPAGRNAQTLRIPGEAWFVESWGSDLYGVDRFVFTSITGQCPTVAP